MRRHVVRPLGIAALLLALLPAHAGAGGHPVRLVGAETDSHCYRDPRNGQVTGFACELMREIGRRVGHGGAVELYPLARALPAAAASPNTLVAPVGRIAAREAQFDWPIALFTEDFVVVTRRTSTADIASIGALRGLDIGIVRGGAGAHMLARVGVGSVSPVTRDLYNARKLASGRIDAWLGSWNAILSAQRAAGLPVEALRRGVVLARVKVYIASSRGADPATLAAWKNAFDTMRADGTYDLLARRFGFVAPAGEALATKERGNRYPAAARPMTVIAW